MIAASEMHPGSLKTRMRTVNGKIRETFRVLRDEIHSFLSGLEPALA